MVVAPATMLGPGSRRGAGRERRWLGKRHRSTAIANRSTTTFVEADQGREQDLVFVATGPHDRAEVEERRNGGEQRGWSCGSGGGGRVLGA